MEALHLGFSQGSIVGGIIIRRFAGFREKTASVDNIRNEPESIEERRTYSLKIKLGE